MALSPGTPAPDFTLASSTGEKITLSAFQGDKAVALVFVPFAFTAVCQGEFCALRDDIERYEAAGVQVLGISCDSAPTLKQWASEQGYNFPLVSDFHPHGAVAQAYGVFNEALGCANRGTFVINTDGVIVEVIESANLGTPRDAEAYQAALAKL
jgi:mycoredoxin-dependent peroxiredoxin